MKLTKLTLAAVGLAVGFSGFAAVSAQAAEQFIPSLVYRTGPYAPNGTPFANGAMDYYKLLNARDGGINGVKLVVEECDTGYNTDRGVECYERLKGKGSTGAAAFSPLSTGITYAIIERATKDKIPVFSMGYGRTDASDGRVFPYVFSTPSTYWSQASALVRYVGNQEGGLDKLKGKKIALVYHDSAYGKEPIATLEALSAKYGFSFHKFPVTHPGLEQKATWLTIGRKLRPDWTFMWGWGVMNQTAIKEAAAAGYPMNKFIGAWWSGAEPDTRPAGKAAIGYKSSTFHSPGSNFIVHQDILKHVYGAGNGTTTEDEVGEVLYNRGLINSVFVSEAIRNAMSKYGNKPMTGEQVRWGFENMNLTSAKLSKLGLTRFMKPVKVTCENHEGGTPLRIQEWKGQQWEFVSDWIEPMNDVVRPMIEASAAKYAAEKGITPRKCDGTD
jgi:branched-chain amino acid transport system substrate-binding protein